VFKILLLNTVIITHLKIEIEHENSNRVLTFSLIIGQVRSTYPLYIKTNSTKFQFLNLNVYICILCVSNYKPLNISP